MLRLLIISPHFPPSNAADMQRVRLLLPYLQESGIEAEVLAVEPAQVASPQDPWMAAGLSAEVPVHRVRALGLNWARIPGMGTLPFRALAALRRRGDALLREGRFDLVYFSTTVFVLHVLGPRWKRKFGVPFAMDYQDPWVSDYNRNHPEVPPPGGALKYGVMSWLNRRQEPKVLRACSGITSVSTMYPRQLAQRYEWLEIRGQKGRETEPAKLDVRCRGHGLSGLQPQTSGLRNLPSLVLPFPGDVRDFERVKQEGIRQTVFDPGHGLKHWVYVGRGGEDMAIAVRALFSAIADLRPPISDLRLHFIGSSYAAAGRGVKTMEPLAAEYGLEEIVVEQPDRILYSETLRCLLDADALIIPGSDDPGYTASKIYPYLLAEKPLLAVFHEQSSVVELIRKVGGGTVVPFATGESPESIALRINSEWLACGGPEHAVTLDHDTFVPHTAKHQAEVLAEFFRTLISPTP